MRYSWYSLLIWDTLSILTLLNLESALLDTVGGHGNRTIRKTVTWPALLECFRTTPNLANLTQVAVQDNCLGLVGVD